MMPTSPDLQTSACVIAQLGAIRWRNIKALIEGAGHGGLPGITMTNIRRDPGEKFTSMYPYLWSVAPFQHFVKGHMDLLSDFPHRQPALSEDAALTPHD